jgi:FkbM family methyltransferase
VDTFAAHTGIMDLQAVVKGFLDSEEFHQRQDLSRTGLPEVPLICETNLGFRLYFYMSDTFVGWSVARGAYESPLTAALQTAVTPGMVCCDLGANIGFFTLLMSKLVGSSGLVFAFEPFPKNFALLKKSIAENKIDNIRAFPYAVHEKESVGRLFYTRARQSDYVAMFVAEPSSPACTDAFDGLDIAKVRLDDVIPADYRVGCIKMDIEGSELYAVKGMSRILEKDRPLVFFEFNPYCLKKLNGLDPNELLRVFKSYGYRMVSIEQFGKSETTEFIYVPEIDEYHVSNLAAIPQEISPSAADGTQNPETG